MAPKTNTPPDPAARQQEAAKAPETEKQDDPQQTTVADLPKTLAKVESVDEVKAMKAADDRTTAQPVYDARIEELEGDSADGEPEPRKAAGKNGRTARTRVKYDGRWYAPGEAVPFASAKDAEPYEASRALEPVRK